MTLPETLKAARIEALAFWFAGRKRDTDAPTDTPILPCLSDFEDARSVIAADPLEQIAVELVEAIIMAREQAMGCFMNHYGENPEGASLPKHILLMDAALQKAGVR